MSLPVITVEGRATGDAELRFTPSGKGVANFTIAASDRRKNDAGEWEDGRKVFLRVNCWDQLAENVAESVKKGLLLTVVGKLYQDEYDDKDGVKRVSYNLQAYNVSVSLRYATADVKKVERSSTVSSSAEWASPAPGDSQDENPPF